MNKLFAIVAVAAFTLPLAAQETETKAEEVQKVERKADSDVWPAFFAVGEYPASPDITGIRITIPYSTRQENVSGFDFGLWGRALYFEGFQLNILRNDVKDSCSGFQVGLYNSIGRGDMFNIQVGLWNEAGSLRGFQAGLVNLTGDMDGFQFGIINRSESMYGMQVGVVNIIRSAELQFFPIVNVGF